METYKCIEEFELPFFDADGKMTGGIHKVAKGSIWEYAYDYTGNSDCRLYLKNGNSDFEYIDISYNNLEEFFERIA